MTVFKFDTEWLLQWTEHCHVRRCHGVVVLRHCGNEYCQKHWDEYCERQARAQTVRGRQPEDHLPLSGVI